MFIPIVNTSISASWLILAIIVIRLVFKKMPKAWTCVLWGLVAIRLICPFSIESPLSLIPSAEVIPEEVLYMEGGQRHDPVEFNGIEAPTVQEAVGEAVGETVSQVQTFDVYGALVWLAGMAAMLIYALISYLRLWHRVMVSINERDNIWLCDQIDSPFILGMFCPRIYMPSGMAEEQAAYVIAHEQAHLHRHDHWWKPIGFLLLSIYWFNPLIWVAYILLSRDIELACDEKVIRSMEIADKQAYSEALLVCSVNRRMIAACPLAFGEVGVKARVKSVLNYKKPAFWVVVGSVAICVVVAVCFLTDPAKKDTEALGETVSWIHAPDGVAWHSVLHLDFDMEYSYVETTCDDGLMWNLYSDAKETGKAVRFDAGVPVCWTPAWETSGSHPKETEIEFTVYEGDTEAYSGRLIIICAESEGEVATYEVKLVAPDELVMWQKDATYAGVITLNGDSSSVCKHEPGKLIAEEWREVPNPALSEYKNVEQNWERYICKQCGMEFEVAGAYREMRDDRKEYPVTTFLSEEDFADPVATAEKLLSRAFSFDPSNYKSEVSQNGDFWNITFDGEHHYVVELTPKLPYPQTLYEFRRVPPGGYGEVEIQVEGELVDIAEDFMWNAYALKGEDAQIEVAQGEEKICVQFVFSDTAIFQVRIHTGDLQPSGILFFNNLETAKQAMGQKAEIQNTAEERTMSTELGDMDAPDANEIQQSDVPENYIGGDKNLILARGGKLLPNDDPGSFVRIEGIYYKLYEDKNGILRKEYDLGNRDQLKSRLLEKADQLVNGEFPVNSNGESYGDHGLSQFVGYDPELGEAVGTNGEKGYVRESDVAALVIPPADKCPHEFLINLYESDGITVIGEFPVSCGGHFSGNGMKVEEVKAALADSSLLIEQTSLVNGDFPQNANGETYGNALMIEALGRYPDLQAAIGTEGQAGYVRTADLDHPEFSKPQEAVEWQLSQPTMSYVPLYDFQGNEIGVFRIESKILSAEEKELLMQ